MLEGVESILVHSLVLSCFELNLKLFFKEIVKHIIMLNRKISQIGVVLLVSS